MDFILEEKFKNIIILILGVMIVLLCVFLFVYDKDAKETLDKVEETVEIKEEVKDVVIDEYYVDIKGAVKKPGVYKVKKGSIVDDVIKLSGGLKSNASTKYINLSYELKNHDVINIYTKTEVKNNSIKEECNCSDIVIDSCDNSSIVTNGSSIGNVSSDKVNINTASIDELLTLDGIGQSKAEAIIEYRKSNKFNSVEDLKNVSGIGDSLYNKVKDNITV